MADNTGFISSGATIASSAQITELINRINDARAKRGASRVSIQGVTSYETIKASDFERLFSQLRGLAILGYRNQSNFKIGAGSSILADSNYNIVRLVYNDSYSSFRCQNCTTNCVNTCSGDCATSCSSGNCYNSCSAGCVNGCSNTCVGCQGCTGCGDKCSNSCSGGCSEGCTDCSGGCSGSCEGNCSGSCGDLGSCGSDCDGGSCYLSCDGFDK